MERCKQRRTPSKIIRASQVGQRNENRANSEIDRLEIAARMISRTCRMVASGVDGGRRTSASRSTRTATSSRSVPITGRSNTVISTLAGLRPNTAQCRRRMSILACSTAWFEGRLQASACSATILSVRRSPEPPTMIGT